MRGKPPIGLKNGIFAHTISAKEIVVSFVKDGQTLDTYNCAPAELTPIILVLLTAAVAAHTKNGGRPNPGVATRFANYPIPPTKIALLPSQKPETILLSLQFGRVDLVVGLGETTGRELGEALIAASASGLPH